MTEINYAKKSALKIYQTVSAEVCVVLSKMGVLKCSFGLFVIKPFLIDDSFIFGTVLNQSLI